MRKIISKIAGTFLGLSLALGVGVVASKSGVSAVNAADTLFYTLTPANGSNNSYAGNCDIAVNGVTWNLTGNSQMQPWRIGGKSLTGVDRALYSKTALSDDVTKIEVTHGAASSVTVNSWTVIVSTEADGLGTVVSSLTPTFAINTTTTISRPSGKSWANCFYKFVYNVTIGGSNKFIEFSEAKFYKESGGSGPTYYTVDFDMQGHGTAPENQSIADGGKVTEPAAPTADGYTFGGWYKDADCGTAWNFTSDTISGPTTIYAKWTEESADGDTLSFDVTSNPGGWPTANETTLTDYTYTLDDVDYTFKLKNVKQNSGYLMLTQPAVLGLPSISGKKLTKVVISNSGGCSTSVKVGISSSSTSESYISGGAIQTFATQGSSYTYNLDDTEEDTVYFVYVTNKNAQFTNIALTYEDVESSGTKIQLYATDIEMNYGDSPVPIVVKNADNLSEVITGCSFETSDSSIASIENGKVVANGKGVATITVTHADDISNPTNTIIYKSTTFSVTVIKPDTIADLYTYAKNTVVEFDGYYAGEYADGIVLMDGTKGMLVYKGASESNWVVDETIVHVKGTTTEYGGLVEIASGATISTLSGPDYTAAAAKLALPSNHHLVAADASSTDKTLGNRRTYVSGVLKSIENASTANCYDVVVTVDSVDLSLYLKAADNVEITLSDSSTSTISNYLSNNVNKNVTIRGFTSFYNSSFQVRVYGILEASETYLVEDFSQDVLDETDKVCSVYSDDNKSRLTKTWGDLEEKWNILSETEKGKWQDTSAYSPNYDNDSESVVENALGRYNLLCKKYFSTNNFTNRSDVNGAPVEPHGVNLVQPITAGNSSTVIIVVVALTSITSIGVLLVIKRKRSLVK